MYETDPDVAKSAESVLGNVLKWKAEKEYIEAKGLTKLTVMD